MSKGNVSENTIKVRLEVELPVGLSAPVTIIVGERTPSTMKKVDEPSLESVGLSPLPPDPALVKVVGSGLTGGICANGIDAESPTLGPCTDVALLCQAPGAPISDDPSSGAVHVTPDNIGYWEYNGVPGATCAWPGTGVTLPENFLIIWKKWQNQPFWVHSVTSFHGKCSDKTDCDTSSEMVSQSLVTRSSGTSSIDTAPGLWNVSVNGFRGEGVTAFNGNWTLIQFHQTAPGNLAWVAGGDSVQQARVELFGQACGCSPFELRFSYQGSVVSYRFARDSWNSVGINQSGSVISSGLAEGIEIPGQVTVIPG